MTWLTTLLQSFARPFQWWVVVAPWEQAVRVRFGRRSVSFGPGMHFRVPFLDRVFVAGTRVRTVTMTGQTVTTRDGKAATVSIAILFRIEDLARLLNSTASPEEVLIARASAAVVRVCREHDSDGLSSAVIAQSVSADMPAGWGLGGIEVSVTAFAVVRTLRVMTAEYTQRGGLDELLKKEDQRTA